MKLGRGANIRTKEKKRNQVFIKKDNNSYLLLSLKSLNKLRLTYLDRYIYIREEADIILTPAPESLSLFPANLFNGLHQNSWKLLI